MAIPRKSSRVLAGLLLLWAYTVAFPARGELPPLDPDVKRDIESILQSVAAIPVTDQASVARRMELISARLRGRPFAWNPVGEGPGTSDPDPLIESRRLDCQTFVELVIALARSDSVEAALNDIVALRYSARPIAFTNRNHFVSVEWLPAAIEAGVLHDITASIPDIRLSSAAITIDRGAWLRTLDRDPTYRGRINPSAITSTEADVRSSVLAFADIRGEWKKVDGSALSASPSFSASRAGP